MGIVVQNRQSTTPLWFVIVNRDRDCNRNRHPIATRPPPSGGWREQWSRCIEGGRGSARCYHPSAYCSRDRLDIDCSQQGMVMSRGGKQRPRLFPRKCRPLILTWADRDGNLIRTSPPPALLVFSSFLPSLWHTFSSSTGLPARRR